MATSQTTSSKSDWRKRPSCSPGDWRTAALARLHETFRRYPEVYAAQVLGVAWWDKQREIARALIEHKRVLVKASHGVGKSHVAAGLILWSFDCFKPSVTISTAPTQSQVVDVLWKEVRAQRRGRPGLQPKAPRLETAADHFAVGYTARDDASFQGRHADHVLIVFDECVGVDAAFWDAAEGMMTGPNCYWLAICNPTDTSSRAYEEELKGKFHVITIPALEHPNIVAELRGEPAPFPSAVRLEWVNDRVAEWCAPLAREDQRAGDIEWPPGSGSWFRPGPLFESRVMGRWPSQSATSVWSDALWQRCLEPQAQMQEPAVIGCDVARFGDDYTSIVVRRGACVLHHETHNGWPTDQTAGRLKELCGFHADRGDPRTVVVNIDDDGVGSGVVDQAGGYQFIGCSGAARANDPDAYPNRRSEAWFAVAQRASDGRIDLSRLADASRALLRRQAMAPTWKLDSQGRRVVEPKSDTKKRLGRSPDDMDALNLAFTSAPAVHLEWLGSPGAGAGSDSIDADQLTGWLCPLCVSVAEGDTCLLDHFTRCEPHNPGRQVWCSVCITSQVEINGGSTLLHGWWRATG